MEVYEIRPLGDGGRVELAGPLGIVERMEVDSAREAALHAQSCAMGGEAVLRIYHPDGTLKNERSIPPKKSAGTNLSTRLPWF